MNSFVQVMKTTTNAVSNKTTTQNNAKSNSYIDPSLQYEGRLGLFYKSVRGVDLETLRKYILLSLQENVFQTFILAFYIRDCRGGKGERTLGRHIFSILAEKEPEKLNALLHLLPEYGRWDDISYLLKYSRLTNNILTQLSTQIKQDRKNMKKLNPVSLCAKWMPTEGHSSDKKLNFTSLITKHLQISKKEWRKKYLTPLRKHIDIVEKRMCEDDWESIDYSKVPSCAMNKLKKAFERHDKERFDNWIDKLKNNEVKINAKQLYPHECIQSYDKCYRSKEDPIIEAQWKVLMENMKNLGTFSNSLVVCDVSGSMTNGKYDTKPIDVAISLGLLIAESTIGDYNGTLITFSEKPEFFQINPTNTLYDKVKQVKTMKWGCNTNLMAVFELILNKATKHKIPASDMPKRLFIISDMQFDIACKSNSRTNFEQIKKLYRKSHYELPQVVFWNVNGEFSDCPIQSNDTGSILVSGFSQSIMKYISETTEFSSIGILETVLNSERYSKIREILA
jgi:hypothetical protein